VSGIFVPKEATASVMQAELVTVFEEIGCSTACSFRTELVLVKILYSKHSMCGIQDTGEGSSFRIKMLYIYIYIYKGYPYVPPLISETMFNTHIERQAKL
jgi:hypothetical protein